MLPFSQITIIGLGLIGSSIAQAVRATMPTARLNRLCKQLLDKTAKAVPHERLLLEAKRRLIYTRSNLDEIAYDLGFQDPAYFSRFFKRATGLTAGRFRSENNFDTTPE
jgi:AraC family transcriptional activator of pobA